VSQAPLSSGSPAGGAAAPAPSAAARRKDLVIRLLVVGGVIGLTVVLYALRDQVRQLEAFGYPGIFLISILTNATLILPLPGVVLTSAFGTVFNPFWVAIAAGSGAAIGELSGYLAGTSGQAVIQNARLYEKLTDWMKRYGDITVLVLAFIPNPAFDVAGIVAGALKLPAWRFLFFCAIGKILKMMLFAYGGATLARWFFP
jgi:membrane protein YqaA with SNARE-associated domain